MLEVAVLVLGTFNAFLFNGGTVRALMVYRTEQAGSLPAPTFSDVLLMCGSTIGWTLLFVVLPLSMVQ